MLIAHAPAGYLVTRVLSRTVFKDIVRHERTDRFYQVLMAAGILGGIFPDIDLLFNMVFKTSVVSHHDYFTHIPMFWLCMWGIGAAIGKIRGDRRIHALVATFCVSAIIHLVLDTITGNIYWLYPLNRVSVNIFEVADVHLWWVKNYLYHWTFLIEIAIVLSAMAVFLRVKETVLYLARLFAANRNLRLISLRIGLCVVGLGVIAVVVSLKFSIDNRIVHKMMQIKHAVVRMVES
jgi:inner membrane protein